jgi:hypothetical protein
MVSRAAITIDYNTAVYMKNNPQKMFFVLLSWLVNRPIAFGEKKIVISKKNNNNLVIGR